MSKKGFTLIELLAVIVIIGLIIGITIPAASKLFGKTSKQQHSYYEKLMVTAAKLYVEENEGVSINCVKLSTLLTQKLLKKSTCNGDSEEGYVKKNLNYTNSGDPLAYKKGEYFAYFKCVNGTNIYTTTYPGFPSGYDVYAMPGDCT